MAEPLPDAVFGFGEHTFTAIEHVAEKRSEKAHRTNFFAQSSRSKFMARTIKVANMTSRGSRIALVFLLTPSVACAVGSTEYGAPSPIGDGASHGAVLDAGAHETPSPLPSIVDASAATTPIASDAAAPSLTDAAPAPVPAPTPSPAVDASTPPPTVHDADVPPSTCIAEGVHATCTACA
jgi:hypothetical protein